MSVENHTAAGAYLFGDTDLAAERLRLLAEVFAPSTREFLGRIAVNSPKRIVDLGCGPGHTTRLLAEVFPRATVLGLDSSSQFISLAKQTPADRVEYLVADVTRALSAGPFDIVYCRYLLTHIAQPHEAIALWGEDLQAGGVVAIEENEWIHTTQPAFARYLEIVEAMLADGGQRLYVGAELAREPSWPSLTVNLSEVVPLAARDSDTARMFIMNIANWRHQPFIERNFSPAEIESLHQDLDRLTRADPQAGSIEFGRRRLVLAKVDASANFVAAVRSTRSPFCDTLDPGTPRPRANQARLELRKNLMVETSPTLAEDEVLKRITVDPAIFGGKPIIRGLRIAVEHVLGMLAAGDTPEKLLAEYPFLEPADIQACMAYAHRSLCGEQIHERIARAEAT